MNFYQKLGPLVFGTRLKRLSDYFLSEVNQVYASRGIPFEASWFGIFYLLGNQTELSIFEIAEQLEVSHSAISQLVKSLTEKGLLTLQPSSHDGRKKVIHLSKSGEELLQKIKPIWVALDKTMTDLLDKNKVLEQIFQLENKFDEIPLSKLINKNADV